MYLGFPNRILCMLLQLVQVLVQLVQVLMQLVQVLVQIGQEANRLLKMDLNQYLVLKLIY